MSAEHELTEIRCAMLDACRLLKLAKCPDEACDGEGTCSGIVPGYDGEADVDCWQCQFCAEREKLIDEHG